VPPLSFFQHSFGLPRPFDLFFFSGNPGTPEHGWPVLQSAPPVSSLFLSTLTFLPFLNNCTIFHAPDKKGDAAAGTLPPFLFLVPSPCPSPRWEGKSYVEKGGLVPFFSSSPIFPSPFSRIPPPPPLAPPLCDDPDTGIVRSMSTLGK